MEDKELQELFAAKRTVETNRRRQEDLAALIDSKTRRTRTLWPLWTASAAAAIALLIVTLPSLFSSREVTPSQMAQAKLPAVIPPQPEEPAAPTPLIKPIANTEPIKPIKPIKPITTIETIDTIDTISLLPTPSAPDPDPDQDLFDPVPRIMRRTSTMLACTDGCPEPADYKEPSKRHSHIEFFSSQQLAEATAYTITFNK